MPDTYIRRVIAAPGSSLSNVTTQTLNEGDNIINHGLGKTVINFVVQDGNDFVKTTGSIIDSNNFNISLAGGSIVNAKITLIYVV